MYTESNKGFTIITNFGCDCNCKYCITKHHPILQNRITDKDAIDWSYLEKCIAESDAPTVNLSGGGDPFYNWENNLDFYNHIYTLVLKYGKEMDVHTRVLPSALDLLGKFRKIALSVENNDSKVIDELRERFPLVAQVTKVRVINVLNEKMTEETCRNYVDIMKSIGIKQITFRQMFGNKAAYENFNKLKNIDFGDGVLFLPDGEYHNYYFTINNTLYPFFFGYTKVDREYWLKRYEDIEQSCM